ncbi:2-nitropropane dioxygenase, NPD [Trichormus variabilis ATCC 29413]|uniref:2-nitropropane dioxygenase, NPD n=2 Tax=Anabaena variabilis TaxID=264691 RepID=Q3MCS9_TRIV2|nr:MULTISPECIES: nitronate monooxygenase family protein [Nostocaceae]ABA21207.1 2-nitropropane dioxygenase, NPD [Trichormus variabilis ATCC 29413]MBC1214138.1 nitronate monooxygenase [Trichormus variabilis ARAD]MBC1257882.1 nitronate monooxygenase [Trichormus variabilis V5]MBC1267805.1 nitronate monooxygenase [Trichormus variabilis FSR]MBC1303893.1 nitronate monooxygenase [Trichormus variabilis N2B]
MNSSVKTRILQPLRIGKHIARHPIIQGAMAVRVSGAKLAGAVANAGGVGVIASLGLGLDSPYFDKRKKRSFFTANRLALIDELAKARSISPDGVIGVNILVATKDYSVLAQTAAAQGADIIITGAGLPLALPEYTAAYPDVALVPSVANLEAAQLICETWQSRYHRLPDALIVENCQQVGGHFTQCEQVNIPGFSLELVIRQLRDYCQNHLGARIPLIVSGGISDRTDIDRMIAIGADGVQIGTRFVTTVECDADQRYKDYHLQAQPEDIVTVPSPVGKPSRALHNLFTEQVMSNSSNLEKRCIANCLETCLCRDHGKTYCLLQALAQAARGDVENGLIFSGANAGYTQDIISVPELMTELTQAHTIEVSSSDKY